MKTIYAWFTVTAVRSWYAHFLVCLAVSALAGAAASWLGLDGLAAMCWASVAALLFYLYKEAGDELRYRREGTFNDRRWADRVKASTDRGGDTLGPCAVCATLWAAWLMQHVAEIF